LSRDALVANPQVNKFAARYRLAAAPVSVEFAGFSVATNTGYAAGLRVGLAYSALEAMEKALKLPKSAVESETSKLCNKLRSAAFDRLFMLFDNELDSTALKNSITSFHNNDSQNLRPVAAGLRHLMFHGQFNPHAAGLAGAPRRVATINQLAEAVLITTDELFTAWCQS
jgi:hypothetical protein